MSVHAYAVDGQETPMKIRILGKTWDLRFPPHEEMGGKAGSCDHPGQRNKSIDVWDELRGEECLDTIIHECLHAGAYNVLGEHFCEQIGTDIARAVLTKDALWRILDDPKVQEVIRESRGEAKASTGTLPIASRPAFLRGQDQEVAAGGAT